MLKFKMLIKNPETGIFKKHDVIEIKWSDNLETVYAVPRGGIGMMRVDGKSVIRVQEGEI